jgi:hypothetical protein
MISVEFTGRFWECIQKHGLDRAAVFAAMQTTATAWGTPHLHSGIGIRRLKGHWFEARTGLQVRLVFQVRKGCLTFHFAGNHDEVNRFAHNL